MELTQRIVPHAARPNPSWRMWRIVIFAVGLCFALIPSFYPITDHEFIVLPIMGVAIFITHLILTLRTLSVVTALRPFGDGAAPFALYTLTNVRAGDWVWGLWQVAFRRTLADHVLFALLRLGLAVGIAQLLHMIMPPGMPYGLGSLFYGSLPNETNPSTWSFSPRTPSVDLIMAGAVILTVFSLLECGLLCALGVLAHALHSNQTRRFMLALLARAAWLGVLVAAWWGGVMPRLQYLDDVNRNHVDNQYQRYQINLTYSETRVLVHNSARVFYILMDNATLLTADVMRPTWGMIAVFRNAPQMLLGALLYTLLIALILRAAWWGARRRGMLA
jgi:hypothetical protein